RLDPDRRGRLDDRGGREAEERRDALALQDLGNDVYDEHRWFLPTAVRGKPAEQAGGQPSLAMASRQCHPPAVAPELAVIAVICREKTATGFALTTESLGLRVGRTENNTKISVFSSKRLGAVCSIIPQNLAVFHCFVADNNRQSYFLRVVRNLTR